MLNQQKILTALNAMQNDNIPLTQKNVIKYGNKYNLSKLNFICLNLKKSIFSEENISSIGKNCVLITHS